ncbi:hypothetical protein KF728_23280 [Candidatus Obscuribacterales bacterium]|nr:hypothetical protein [Candidatus Obscuribacterales bacterium]
MLKRFANPVMLAAALMLVAPAAKALKPGSGGGKSNSSAWETERIYNNWGKHKIVFSRSFFRMDDPIRDFSIVTSGPDWIVYYFSDKKKIIYSTPITRLRRSFSERMGLLTGGRDQDPTHWQKVGKAKLLGQEFDHYRLAKDKSGAPLRRVSFCELFTASMKVEPQVSKMFANLFDSPDMGSIPIRMLTGTQRSHLHMDTLSIKTTVVSPAMRAIPKGYKKVPNAEAVMFEDPSFF